MNTFLSLHQKLILIQRSITYYFVIIVIANKPNYFVFTALLIPEQFTHQTKPSKYSYTGAI